MEQPSDDTPSVTPAGRDSSLREGAGRGAYHSTGYSLKSNVAGDFHRPYEGSETVSFYHSTGDTPSVTPDGRDSSLREGAGNGPYHSTCRSETATLRAIFIAPTELRRFYILPFGEKMGVEFLGRVWYNGFGNRCRISSLVEWSLPKPQRRVRFPYPAPQKALASAGAFLIRKIRFFVEFSEFFGIIMEIPPPMEDMLWMR